jgi:DNA repair exonuclease SbcCD ATPase subunit
MSDIEQELGWMKRSPYTEGWPKLSMPTDTDRDRHAIEVVPLSDAEGLKAQRDAALADRDSCNAEAQQYLSDAERLREERDAEIRNNNDLRNDEARAQGEAERLREALENSDRLMVEANEAKREAEQRAERLREALERISKIPRRSEMAKRIARATLDREGEGINNTGVVCPDCGAVPGEEHTPGRLCRLKLAEVEE